MGSQAVRTGCRCLLRRSSTIGSSARRGRSPCWTRLASTYLVTPRAGPCRGCQCSRHQALLAHRPDLALACAPSAFAAFLMALSLQLAIPRQLLLASLHNPSPCRFLLLCPRTHHGRPKKVPRGTCRREWRDASPDTELAEAATAEADLWGPLHDTEALSALRELPFGIA